MTFTNENPSIRALYEHAFSKGLSPKCVFNEETQDRYIETAIDAYRDYALFRYLFNGKYDTDVFSHMMSVDFRSRIGFTAGIASSEAFESVMLIEPPKAEKPDMADYFKVAHPSDYSLLLRPIMYRMEGFEKYALEKREQFLDERTWYIYVFATKEEFKGRGFGRKLMDILLSFADDNKCRVCLETNDSGNVGMYEHFGFKTAAVSQYRGVLEHYNMIYEK